MECCHCYTQTEGLHALEEVDRGWIAWKACCHRAAAGRGRADPPCEMLSIEEHLWRVLPRLELLPRLHARGRIGRAGRDRRRGLVHMKGLLLVGCCWKRPATLKQKDWTRWTPLTTKAGSIGSPSVSGPRAAGEGQPFLPFRRRMMHNKPH